QASDAVHAEAAISVGGVKAMPAVRALARKLKVDLSRVRGSGADGVVTMADVKRAAADGSAAAAGPHPNPPPRAGEGAEAARTSPPPPAGEGGERAARAGGGPAPATRTPEQRTPLSASGKPM